MPSGTYEGSVVIDKQVSLRGEGWPVLDGNGEGTIIEVTAPGVRIEGFVIRDSGQTLDHEDSGVKALARGVEIVGNRIEDVLFGVYLEGADGAVVTDNEISAKDLMIARRGDLLHVFESDGTVVERNTIVGGRDAVVWFSDDTVVRDNLFRKGRYGMHYMYADDGVLERNRFEENSVAAFLMFSHHMEVRNNVFSASDGPSGYGVGFKDVDGAVLEDNRIVGNRVGVFVDTSPFSLDEFIYYRRNIFAFNDVGVMFQPSIQRNIFSRNAFIDNRQQVAVRGGGFVPESNEWTEDGVGNHWGDYAGFDANGDGIGDMPYRAEDLFGDVTDRHPDVKLFADTPAARVLDLAAKAFPVFRPEARAVDTAPMLDLPDLPSAPGSPAEPSVRGLVGVSVGLLMLAAAIVVVSGAGPRRRTAGVRP
ncbi:MAG: nitrous oxide reductase family maturation protein NosD [Acidimicrobiia bacterium]|nr:nitrous oxide reductase family maturation protein NosD [Acidimicrobiia bacterium]